MFSIILLILKIIGMILLVIIGLLLFLLLTVLLVPVRYKLSVTHGEELFRMEGTISWLLHFLHAKISVKDKKPHIRVQIFGIIVFDNLRVKTAKPKRTKKNKSERMKFKRKHKNKTKVTPIKSIPKTDNDSNKTAILKEEEANKEKTHEVDSLEQSYEADSTIDGDKKTSKFINNDEKPEIEIQQRTMFQKILDRIKRMKEKINTFFHGIKERIMKWIDMSANIKRKIDLLLEFVKDEINREAFKLTYSSLIKLMKHILPTRLRSRLAFGTGDPYTTGQALSAMGILYSFYGDKIVITPDFENRRFEGQHDARGRIRLVTLLIIVIKLILDKRFKQLKNNVKTLKEAL